MIFKGVFGPLSPLWIRQRSCTSTNYPSILLVYPVILIRLCTSSISECRLAYISTTSKSHQWAIISYFPSYLVSLPSHLRFRPVHLHLVRHSASTSSWPWNTSCLISSVCPISVSLSNNYSPICSGGPPTHPVFEYPMKMKKRSPSQGDQLISFSWDI